ncbi:hypothetical protein [Pseudanabaena sp. FACHB-2040]|uniref:hypothetical protein n=1 Tax=Pseudanabaena sp. FACHB-2040 TaxID=2692859 RepID=UPI00168489E4|nr:hypothetical protein [Pseudanabaena sp. FACHB-2040]MBD2261383.1 hypothetical protein [Pseudanabaena sp. FACHB-2040]
MTEPQVSRQTQAIANRLRKADPTLTQQQAIHRAVWLQEQARVVDELTKDFRQEKTNETH